MDSERRLRNQEALRSSGLTAVVCALPANVLLMSGYWPVVGSSIAICVCDGPTILLVPEDEAELTETGFADSVETFVPEKLTDINTISQAVKPHLRAILGKLKIVSGLIGIETGSSSLPVSYLAQHLYGDDLRNMLQDSLPEATFTPIDEWMRVLRSVKTEFELERMRQACEIAKRAFETGAPKLSVGMSEHDAAESFRAQLNGFGIAGPQIQRSDGFAFCMSGPNSAKASAAYARTRQRKLEASDLVMMHCNSYVDGFWTDITRTYTLQPSDEQQETLYSAVFEARQAAFSIIRPGVRAMEVDAATQEVLRVRWSQKSIKHGTGHGVGVSAMSAHTIPRIHSASPDILREGMVFNVEPALYVDGYGGVRHCDMVAVTKDGHELLTNFQSDIGSVTKSSRSQSAHT